MKKNKKSVSYHLKVSNVLACLALVFASVAANTVCCCIYHQPEKPDLKSLRRY